MAQKVKPIPEGFQTITPYIALSNAAEAIEFYKRAFGATEVMRSEMGGRIGHAEVKIGDSILMVSDEFPGGSCKSAKSLGGTPVSLWLYVDDVDALYNRAVAAGAKVIMPVGDQFWGDRFGQLADPYGNVWSLATHKEDVTLEEVQKRAAEAMKKMSQPHTSSATQ